MEGQINSAVSNLINALENIVRASELSSDEVLATEERLLLEANANIFMQEVEELLRVTALFRRELILHEDLPGSGERAKLQDTTLRDSAARLENLRAEVALALTELEGLFL